MTTICVWNRHRYFLYFCFFRFFKNSVLPKKIRTKQLLVWKHRSQLDKRSKITSIFFFFNGYLCIPGASLVAQSVKNLPVVQDTTCSAGDRGSTPGSGGSPGEGNGNPLQYSCLENPTDRGAWRATVHGVARVGHVLSNETITPFLEDDST